MSPSIDGINGSRSVFIKTGFCATELSLLPIIKGRWCWQKQLRGVPALRQWCRRKSLFTLTRLSRVRTPRPNNLLLISSMCVSTANALFCVSRLSCFDPHQFETHLLWPLISSNTTFEFLELIGPICNLNLQTLTKINNFQINFKCTLILKRVVSTFMYVWNYGMLYELQHWY